MQDFLDYLRNERCLSPRTIESYHRTLQRLETRLPNLVNATRDQIRSALVVLQGEGLDGRTLARYISTLRHYYSFKVRRGEIRSTPMNHPASEAPKHSAEGGGDRRLRENAAGDRGFVSNKIAGYRGIAATR